MNTERKCQICEKDLKRGKYFCSYRCHGFSRPPVLTKETLQKLRDKPPFKGKKHTKETKRLLSIAAKNRTFKQPRGELNPRWRGTTPLNRLIRKRLEYKAWRTLVFERDNYTCVHCGDHNHEGREATLALHADHIQPFALFPELRFEVSNGRTLCVPCHKQTPTWGGRTKQKSLTI